MSIFAKAFKNQETSTLSKPRQWLVDFFGGRETSAGISVNEMTAMNSAAVYACVRILSESIASLPLPVYKRLEDGGKTRDPTHPLYRVLHDQANPEMTAFAFRELLESHVEIWGNGYAEIEWNRAGDVRALWPLRPDQTWMERDKKTQKLYYWTHLPDGTLAKLPFERVFHVQGLGDGLQGYSPIQQAAKEAIGLSLATQEFGAKFFKNGTHPGGIVEYPSKLKQEAIKQYEKSVHEAYGGLSNAHRLMVLEQGLKYHQVGVPPETAQYLETRVFQLREIARIYRVPLYLLADHEKGSSYNSTEQQSLDFVKHTIRPRLVRWEQAIKMKLLTPFEKKRYFAEFIVDALLRGDIKTRYEAYQIARQSGWMNGDEIRAKENMNPMPDDQGKVYLVNGNMISVEKASKQDAKSASQKATK